MQLINSEELRQRNLDAQNERKGKGGLRSHEMHSTAASGPQSEALYTHSHVSTAQALTSESTLARPASSGNFVPASGMPPQSAEVVSGFER